MSHVLLKYKSLELLINNGDEASTALLSKLEEINNLKKSYEAEIIKGTNCTDKEITSITERAKQIQTALSITIFGLPFTIHDARLYAANKKWHYDILELT